MSDTQWKATQHSGVQGVCSCEGIEVTNMARYQQSEAIDRVPRYAPSKVIIAQAMKLADVDSYHVYPPNVHPDKCPIKPEYTVLECRTQYGSRWFGCESAHINSELRMVVIGFDTRDEVRAKWEVCNVI